MFLMNEPLWHINCSLVKSGRIVAIWYGRIEAVLWPYRGRIVAVLMPFIGRIRGRTEAIPNVPFSRFYDMM